VWQRSKFNQTTKGTKPHEGENWGFLYLRVLVNGKRNLTYLGWPQHKSASRRKMEVDIVPGGHREAVKRGRLVVPPPERRHNLFVDPMPDGLQNAGLDDVTLRVDSDFDNDVALHISGEFGTRDRRVRIHDGISHVHFMTSDRPVDHGAQRRSGPGIVLGAFRIRGPMVGRRFCC
jgi:hypothetical protein